MLTSTAREGGGRVVLVSGRGKKGERGKNEDVDSITHPSGRV